MTLFTGRAPDLIALAEDEARMLGRRAVEPVHLLLAFARQGPVRDLLEDRGVAPSDLHAEVVRQRGLGDELALGRLPRTRTSDGVLDEAVTLAARRGEWPPSEPHVLLALASDEAARAILADVGIDDVPQLVDDRYPPRGPALGDAEVRGRLVAAALTDWQRFAHVPVPAFERFTPQARRAIRAAAESAALLEHREVEPFHLLLGCLRLPDSFAARVIWPVWEDGELGAIGEAIDLVLRYGPNPSHQATGMFSAIARRVVAEDALALTYRLGHERITSAHLLLAALDSRDRTIEAITRPHTQRLARSLMRGLPGGEPDKGEDEANWIQFDALIRMLVWNFRRIVPAGWTVFGSARSDIHLKVPGSRSESDFQIRPGWIVAEDGPAPVRLRRVTGWMLERLQAAVMEASGRPWPEGPDGEPGPAHAELVDDRYNPRLRLGYGDPASPVLVAVEHDLYLNMAIGSL